MSQPRSSTFRERPILFSGEVVRTILEGRKTQTRRVIKPQPELKLGWTLRAREKEGYAVRVTPDGYASDPQQDAQTWRCPYGVPGGRLWVRETLVIGSKNNGAPRLNGVWRYAADNTPVDAGEPDESAMLVWAHHKESEYCASIHMPRWASRITLELTAVRVERVQDISEADAKAEGAGILMAGHQEWDGDPDQYRKCFHELWNSINAKRGFPWDANPWVWVLEFARIGGSQA